LDILHLNLARRTHFRLYGGTRFGGTVTLEDAFDRYGFHHVALAAGAGRPTIIGLKNNLIRGVRKASDFLMALQLTGAFKKGSQARLQVALPAVVIGGGLTAIDTATELAAYYPIQVEKLLERHEKLCESGGEEMVFSVLDPEERHLYAEALEHGRAVRAERERVAGTSEAPDFGRLVKAWGGVTIAYRKTLNDSPAFRLEGQELVPAEVSDDLTGSTGFFTSYAKNGRRVSFFGDNHPVYAGSVVKAMASAKDGYPQVAALFAKQLAAADGSAQPAWAE